MRNYQLLKEAKSKRRIKKKSRIKMFAKKTLNRQRKKIIIISLFFKFSVILSLFILFLFFKKGPDSTLNQSYLKSPKYLEYENEYSNTNSTCDILDPINLFKKRIDNGPIELCEGKKSKHICYQNGDNYYNDIYAHKKGNYL